MKQYQYQEYRYPLVVQIWILAICYPTVMLVAYNFFEIISIHQILSDYFVNHQQFSAEDFEVQFDIMICLQALGSITLSTLLGFLCDKFGYKIILFTLSLIIFGSQVILILGYNNWSFLLIDLGRFLSSVCFVCILIPMSQIIKKYFGPDNQFSLFNSILVSFWILGGILNSFIAPSIVLANGLIKGEMTPLFLSVIASILCWLLCLVDLMNDRNYISQAMFEDCDQETQETGDDQTRSAFSRFRQIMNDHPQLFITLMIQRGIVTMFIFIASGFFYQYWGDSRKEIFFLSVVYDTDLVGLFWVVTLILLFPAGIIINTYKDHKLHVMLCSSISQTIGLMLLTILEPFYTMPLLGIAMALRWASLSPIILDRFPKEFGTAYGAISCLSGLVTLTVSLAASFIFQQTGSYLHALILINIMQVVGLVSLVHYIIYDPHKYEQEVLPNLSY